MIRNLLNNTQMLSPGMFIIRTNQNGYRYDKVKAHYLRAYILATSPVLYVIHDNRNNYR